MSTGHRPLGTAGTLLALSLVASANSAAQESADEDPFAPLLVESRPLTTRLQTDYTGSMQIGLGYVSDDNFMYGQYNGRQDEGAHLIGKLDWNRFQNTDRYWRVTADNLGLDTREGAITWGKIDRVRVTLGFDSQSQIKNNSGSTPFSGKSSLRLPEDWSSGLYTGQWRSLENSLTPFNRELERQGYHMDVDVRLNQQWKFESSVRYEDKSGTEDVGAAIFIDAASGDASLLPSPVDYQTSELDLGLLFEGNQLRLNGELSYSDFNNDNDLLRWQNPYSSFGPAVRYPEGTGGLAQAPDNNRVNGRLSGHYVFSSTTRLQFDGSYGVTRQDQDFLPYTVNPNLSIAEPLPLSSLDGEVATGIGSAKLLMRPLPKLNLALRYKGIDKDYDAPREGYRYVPGDGGSQSREQLTVYNTRHNFQSHTAGIEGSYRLPLNSRLRAEYEFENIQRENAAVEETDESRYLLAYRISPWASFSANAEISFGNRAADTYQWAQSYYALLDTSLINATPDNQRYQNHPQMSQFYLSNRERLQGKLDLNYQPAMAWNLNLNLLLHEDDYDKSELGLTDADWQRLQLSASYAANEDFVFSVYAGFDTYNSSQSSRAFRGSQEKNAFAAYAPLPQASDPQRNWDLDNSNLSTTLGANLSWQLSETIKGELDYSFVDTQTEQDFTTYGASDLATSDLPTIDTTMHHIRANGSWQLREALSLRIDYEYYRYSSNDWALQNVNANTLDKVLTFGDRNPNEQIHYVGTSLIYHWQ